MEMYVCYLLYYSRPGIAPFIKRSLLNRQRSEAIMCANAAEATKGSFYRNWADSTIQVLLLGIQLLLYSWPEFCRFWQRRLLNYSSSSLWRAYMETQLVFIVKVAFDSSRWRGISSETHGAKSAGPAPNRSNERLTGWAGPNVINLIWFRVSGVEHVAILSFRRHKDISGWTLDERSLLFVWFEEEQWVV